MPSEIEQTAAGYKPTREEAQFLGELLNVHEGLARIARDLLAKGTPLSSVIEQFKAAAKVAAAVRGDAA